MSAKRTRHVIIGNSAAGVSAAETIRRLDPEASITIISDEPHPFYSRCLTSYYIAGAISEGDMCLRGPGYYSEMGFEAMLGRRAVRIDPEARMVFLKDEFDADAGDCREDYAGVRVPYDRLLIATGGNAKLPDIPGAHLDGVFVLRTWNDANRILARASRSKKAVIVGGGLVGMKVAHALYERGLAVHMLVSSGRVLSQMVDDEAGEMLRDHLEKHGLVIETRADVAEITGSTGSSGRGSVEGVVTNTGRRIECQMVVTGKGVEPNIGLALGAGIETNRGILVDSRMRTSVPDIYAAGDVAEGYDVAHEGPRVNALWTQAVEQGKVAGSNMAGREREYAGGIGMNSLELFGVPVISMGITSPRVQPGPGSSGQVGGRPGGQPGGQAVGHTREHAGPADRGGQGFEVLSLRKPGNWYRKLVLKDGMIKGAIFVGGVEKAGVVLALIKKRVNVNASGDAKYRILHDDFTFATFIDLIDEKAGFFEGGGKRNVQRIMQGGH
ncbi:MAG: NAD(P)/FAD-dependent oxidoreductase [Firmicutes bacterium]|nr:NAD(P)/FAD-dependent oxidoreductase [Bacillota bacterium]